MYSTEVIEFAELALTVTTSQLVSKQYKALVTQVILETAFLPEKSTLRHRLYYIHNNIYIRLLCPICRVNALNWKPDYNILRDYCSVKCMSNSPAIKQKKQETTLVNFGVSNPSKSNIIQERTRNTNELKYGSPCVLTSSIIQDRIAAASVIKNGTIWPARSTSANNKRDQTNIEKYGNKYTLSCKSIQDKIKKTSTLHWGVDFPFQSNEFQTTLNTTAIKDSRKKTSIQNWGHEYPSQSPEIQAKIRSTNNNLYCRDHYSQIQLTDDTLLYLNDKNWLLEQHHNKQRTLSDISDELGVNGTTLSNYFTKHNIQILTKHRSQAERDIVDIIQQHIPTLEILTNNRSIIYPKELDIYLPGKQIAIEYCGLYWHSDKFVTKSYHQNKYDECKKQGIRLITIFADEWLNHRELVVNKILNILQVSTVPRIFARKCTIHQVNTKDKRVFYDQNHIQGSGPGSITYGLYFDNTLTACMTFIKKQNNIYELNRFATSCSIVGGASKLLSYFTKHHPDFNEIISFADQRWSQGDLYETLGFTYVHTTPPIYEYVVNSNRVHRSLFCRSLLPIKLGSMFNPMLTEFQNMDQVGVPRIWNCGLRKYLLKNNLT